MGEAYQKLLEFRSRKDLKLKPMRHLKETFTDFSGQERPLALRYYQVQGILHLLFMKRFLLGDDTGLGKCQPLDTRVLTRQGFLPLRDMGPQDKLEPDTFYPATPGLEIWTGWNWSPVRRFYFGGLKPILRVHTRRGYETEGTLVHPLWVRRPSGEVFTPLRDIRVGDFLCLDRSSVDFPVAEPPLPIPDSSGLAPNARHYDLPNRLSPDLAALLGYLVSEGHTNSPYTFAITQYRCVNPEVHDHIRALCRNLFGWEGNDDSVSRETLISVTSRHIRRYLEGLGIKCDLAASKTIPWPVQQGTKASVRAFLRAFFDGEGSVLHGVLEVSSASERLLQEIQVLLLRFGVVSTRAPKKVQGYDHTYWRLTICGDDARRFHSEIGFLTPRKQEALQELFRTSANANLDVVPECQGPVERLRDAITQKCSRKGSNETRKGTGLKQFGVSFEKTLNNIRDGGRNPTYAFLLRMLDVARTVGVATTDPVYETIAEICRSHRFYDPVVSITASSTEVADIEVEDPRHSFVSNGFINHNTLESIGALCGVWEQDHQRKAIILTTKSATPQWAREFLKFTKGVRVVTALGTPARRTAARELFEKSVGPTVLIMGYRTAVQDFRHLQNLKGYILILDEATVFKNPRTQVHQICRHFSSQAERVWALTATLIKNNLMEGFGIYEVVAPGLFRTKDGRAMSYNQFMLYYCLVRMQPIPHSNRQIPVIVGYSPDKIQEFRENIDPYFIGRPKHEVASELPALVMHHMEVELTPLQASKYNEALNGLLELGEGDTSRVKEVTKLTAISYFQEIVNHLGMLDIEAESPKLEALVDLLTEGDFAEEKVIVFSRFKKMINAIMPRLAKEKIKAVRITGDEDDAQRDEAMKSFQDPNSDVRVVCLTAAGTESINLQAAKALVCIDTPWSAGDFLQLIGRMIRIGSPHDRCFVIHMLARNSDKDAKPKTIDHHVIEVLSKKMNLVEAVLGKRLKGEDDSPMISADNDIAEIFAALRENARQEKAA